MGASGVTRRISLPYPSVRHSEMPIRLMSMPRNRALSDTASTPGVRPRADDGGSFCSVIAPHRSSAAHNSEMPPQLRDSVLQSSRRVRSGVCRRAV